jgi:peptidoglycan/LPS O-acetylase OafA/YrhL
MIVRLAMLACAALTAVGGLSASAYSVTQGATDQAIAFGWPTVAIALAIAMLAPPRRRTPPRATPASNQST